MDLHRALARAWDLPFVDVPGTILDPELVAGLDHAELSSQGWLPLHRGRDGRVLVAVTERPGAALRARIETHVGAEVDFAVTSSWDIAKGLTTLYRDAIVDEAAHGLWRRSPQQSALTLPSRRLRALLAALVVVVLVAAVLAPATSLLAAVLVLAAAHASGVASVAVVTLAGRRRTTPRLADDMLPVHTVLVPVPRGTGGTAAGSAALRRTLAGLVALDYPADKLEVLLLVQEGDRATRAGGHRGRHPRDRHVPGRPAGRPRDPGAGLQRRAVLRPRRAARGARRRRRAGRGPAAGRRLGAAPPPRGRRARSSPCRRRSTCGPSGPGRWWRWPPSSAPTAPPRPRGRPASGCPCPWAGPAATCAPRCCGASAAGTRGTTPRTPTWACAATGPGCAPTCSTPTLTRSQAGGPAGRGWTASTARALTGRAQATLVSPAPVRGRLRPAGPPAAAAARRGGRDHAARPVDLGRAARRAARGDVAGRGAVRAAAAPGRDRAGGRGRADGAARRRSARSARGGPGWSCSPRSSRCSGVLQAVAAGSALVRLLRGARRTGAAGAGAEAEPEAQAQAAAGPGAERSGRPERRAGGDRRGRDRRRPGRRRQ